MTFKIHTVGAPVEGGPLTSDMRTKRPIAHTQRGNVWSYHISI